MCVNDWFILWNPKTQRAHYSYDNMQTSRQTEQKATHKEGNSKSNMSQDLIPLSCLKPRERLQSISGLFSLF